MKYRSLTFPKLLISIIIILILVSFLFDNIAFSWIIVGIAIVYSLRMTYKYGRNWLKDKRTKVAQRERFLLFLVSLMLLFLAMGTAWYLWAFYVQHDDSMEEFRLKKDVTPFLFINAEYLLRSIVCSFQLFTASIDSNVLDGIKDHYYIKGLISIQAILSFSCTIAILISLVSARLKAYIKLHKQTTIDQGHNHLYVFFGLNAPSRLLANSISKNDGKALTIFVENSHLDEDDNNGWNSIMGMFVHRRQTFVEADELNARVTFTEARLCDIDIEDLDNDNQGNKDVLEKINLRKLRELILKLKTYASDSELHIFFLSDNEDENIQAMSVLARDATINEINDTIKQKFYCHARQNGLNRVVENIAVKRGLEVRIIDSSHLSIELLKADERYHPVQLVELDENIPTTVKSELNCLIIGFDEAGQDAMRFLYEFGAFVSNKGTVGREIRSPFHCIAIDKRMDELEGIFATFAPDAIKRTNDVDKSKLIDLKKCDCMSSDFFENILCDKVRNKLNYVVITVGNDDLGMMLAIRILNYIRKEREDLSRLRIYVRSYRPDRESYMQRIADYYNEGYNQDCKDKDNYKSEAIIIPFGQSEKIYSYDMIVREDLTQQGKSFQKRYCEMKGETEFWDIRRALLTGAKEKIKNEDGKKNIVDVPKGKRKVSLNNMRMLRRKESQDLANALHASTKLFLLQKAFGVDYDWKGFVERYFDEHGNPQCEGTYDMISYPRLSPRENMAILNLARLEHLRWNASHEMLGYTKAIKDIHSCEERTRQHNCLRPWEELDNEGRTVSMLDGWTADYKAFDFGVVDVSIWLRHKGIR